MQRVLPVYDMLYTNIVGELWYFDEDGNLSHTLRSRKGASQGCGLWVFIFCVTMDPVYTIL